LQENDVVAIKREIIGLMISVPTNLQVQLGEATSIIAESDFFERWDTLVDVSFVCDQDHPAKACSLSVCRT
jgi:exportin-2 (importin alpha re-exporter)